MADAASWEQDFEKKFPTWAWILDQPGMKQALTNQDFTSNDQLLAAIENTDWWKHTEAPRRSYEQLAAQDPESLNQQRRVKEAEVWDLYNRVGLKPDVADVQNIANQALQLGWDQNQLTDVVTSHLSYSPDAMRQVGAIQQNASALQQQAAQYYVNLDDESAFNFSKQILNGEKKAEDFTPYFQQQAVSLLGPSMEQSIKAGVTPRMYFQNYQQDIAQMTGLDANAVNMTTDPVWSRIAFHSDPKTGERRPMTRAEAQQYTRTTDYWAHGPQGQQTAAGFARALVQDFGKASFGSGSGMGAQ